VEMIPSGYRRVSGMMVNISLGPILAMQVQLDRDLPGRAGLASMHMKYE
jgi:hypothetical protein